MRLRNIPNAYEIISRSSYFVSNPTMNKGKWNEVFNNNNTIEIEIGMGKGNFIINKAINNPEINYIGIEKYNSVLVKAFKKMEELEIKNLKIISFDASKIDECFDKEISKIYLNFSDPWPKKRHAKRRLTHECFLNSYEKIVKEDLFIEMKTDNLDLFNYSKETLSSNGFELIDIDNNYGINKNNVYKTEYEEKFIKDGKKINHLLAVKKLH